MEDGKTAVARAIVRDLINAVSEGLDIAGTVEQVPHKMAAVGGAIDRVVDKYGLDAGMIAALAVMAEDIELKEPVQIDYAAIEQRIAMELHGSLTGRTMQLNENLTIIVGKGGLTSWAQANAIYSMVSAQALDGVNDYFLEHGILPLNDETTAAMIMVRLLARADDKNGEFMDEPALMAAHCGTLAFLALVRHSEELVRLDTGDGHVDHANLMGNLNHVDSGRNAPEVPMQTIPTSTPPFVSNPKFRMEEEAAAVKTAPQSNQIAESDSLPAFDSNPSFRTEGTETGRASSSPNLQNIPKEAMTAYCLKCKAQVIPEDAELVEGNGSPVFQGKCPTCKSKVRRQLPKAKKEDA